MSQSSSSTSVRPSFYLFLALAVFILVAGFYYLGIRVVRPLVLPSILSEVVWSGLAVPFLFILWLPLFHWRRSTLESVAQGQQMVLLAYGAIGFLSVLFFVVLARDFLEFSLDSSVFLSQKYAGSVFRLPASFGDNAMWMESARASFAVIFITFLLYGLGRWESWRTPRVKRIEIPFKNLPKALAGFRIVQLSDVHVGPSIKKEFVTRVVARVNELQPDLIALTGDIVDGTTTELREDVAPFADLRAKEGVFYVTGNHEYYWGVAEWIAEMERLGMTVLSKTHRLIERGGAKLCIAGIPDYWGETATEIEKPVKSFMVPAADLKILLAHQPKSAFAAEEQGFDLQICGHTHGGQFIPWTFMIRFFQPFIRGLNRCGRMWLYVSQGTGSWGPRLRLGAPSEITEIILMDAGTARPPKIQKTLVLPKRIEAA